MTTIPSVIPDCISIAMRQQYWTLSDDVWFSSDTGCHYDRFEYGEEYPDRFEVSSVMLPVELGPLQA